MNCELRLRTIGLVAVLGALYFLGTPAAPARGAALTWDPTSSGGSSPGGPGNWDNFDSQWYNGSGDQAWSPGDAAFTTTAGTVAITDPSVTVNNLFFSVSGYQITGNTLALSGGTVSLPRFASETINAPITGSGPGVGLTQTGTGTLSLGGPDYYTGPTNVSSGTLLINGLDDTSGISVGVGSKSFGALGGSGSAPAAIVSLFGSNKNGIIAGNNGVGSLTLAGLTFSGQAYVSITNVGQYSTTSSAAVVVTGSNALTVGLVGSVALDVGGTAPSGTGTIPLLQYSGSIASTGGALSGGNSTAFTLSPSFTNAGGRAFYSLVDQYSPASHTGFIGMTYNIDHPVWTGGGNGVWTTQSQSPANWTLALAGSATNFLSGDAVLFDDTATGTTAVSISGTAAVLPSSVAFNNTAKSYTLTGTYGIAGQTSLALDGGGAVTIANSNGYTGGTFLNSGRLNVNNPSALGSGVLSINGGTLDNTSGAPVTLAANNPLAINGSFVFGGSGALNLGTGSAALGNAATVYLPNSTPLTIGGAMTDNGTGLTINGQGLLVLTGNSSGYTGPTNVNGGTLSVGNGGGGAFIGNSSGVNLANNATIVFNHSDNTTFVGAINGTGNLVQTGSGTLALSGISGYSGATVISGGVLQTGAAGQLPSTTDMTIGNGGTFDMTGGTQTLASLSSTDGHGSRVLLGASGMLTVGNTSPATFDGAISGAGGSVTMQGPGPWVLTGSNTYGGGTTVSSGTLQVGDGVSKAGGIAGSIVLNNSAVVFATPAAQSPTYGGVIGGYGSFTKTGPGTLLLAANQSYSGPTFITAGMLRLGSSVSPSGTGSISGFGANTSGVSGVGVTNGSWTFNSYTYDSGYLYTPVTNGVLDLTDGTGTSPGSGNGDVRAAFYNTLVPVNASFRATFTYTPTPGASVPTDANYENGFAFVLQNDSRGLSAYGQSGRGFGVGADPRGTFGGTPISPSMEIDYDVFQGDSHGFGQPSGAGTNYNTNGGTDTSITIFGGNSYVPGDPINMTVTYNAQTAILTWSGIDVGNGMTFTESQTGVNLVSVTGGTSAYIGFTGGTGYVGCAQSISNFLLTQNLTPTNILPVTTDLFIASGGTLDLFAGFQQVDSLSGSGAVTNSGSGQVATLAVSGAQATTFAGTIADGLSPVALAVTGGTLTLSGSNTFTGGTTVDGGTLIVTNNEGLAGGSSLIVGDLASDFAPLTPAAAAPGGAAATPVPEPGALLLSAAVALCGATALYPFRRFRRRRRRT